MEIGKLTITNLKKLIFNNIKNKNKQILSTPEIGTDCAVIDTGSKLLYLSTDPITGSSTKIGKLAVNINCNDIATEGTAPLGILITILAPPKTLEQEIKEIMIEIQKECCKLDVTILGGHTEITTAVNQIVISATAVGLGEKSDYLKKETIKAGDRVVITKGVGIEGTAIISSEKEKILSSVLSQDILKEAKNMINSISVVKDGILSREYAKDMHDITEGGLLGALWEISSLYNLGIKICYDDIYIPDATKQICEHFKIDPLKLISSGTMLIICEKDSVTSLINKLKKYNIDAFDIGYFTKNLDKILEKNTRNIVIEPPLGDELYKII